MKEYPNRTNIKPYEGENVDYIMVFWNAALIGGILVAVALLIMSAVLNSIADAWWGSRLNDGLSWLLLIILIVVALLCDFINMKVMTDNGQAEYDAYVDGLVQEYKSQMEDVEKVNNIILKQWEQNKDKVHSDLQQNIDRKVGVDRKKSGWEDDWASFDTQQVFSV